MKNLLDVINVGQADSFILRPERDCVHKEYDILVDLGNGDKDITKFIGDKVKVIITHSHEDHIDGFKYFIGSDFQKIDELILPKYHNEIILIAKFLLKIKGIDSAKNCEDLVKYFNRLLSGQCVLNKISKDLACRFVSEGSSLCGHMIFLNPPNLYKNKEEDLFLLLEQDNFRVLYEIFDKKYVNEIINVLRIKHNNRQIFYDYPEYNDLIIYKLDKNKEYIYDTFGEDVDGRESVNYILDFFISNTELIFKFIQNPTLRYFKPIVKNYKLNSNDASIVFKYESKNSILFTGDASTKIFRRLIKSGADISAKYLKVPHHGSKYNLNKKTVEHINPQVAIISHDNGKFGSSKDSHPNKEILDLLDLKKIKILLTNEVEKEGNVVRLKTPLGKFDSNIRLVE